MPKNIKNSTSSNIDATSLSELLLLSSLSSADKKEFLTYLAPFSERFLRDEVSLSALVESFYRRSAYLLSPFWEFQIFEPEELFLWRVNPLFLELPSTCAKFLQDLINLSKSATIFLKLDSENELNQIETSLLNHIENLTFICIVAQQESKYVTGALSFLKENQEFDYIRVIESKFNQDDIQERLRLLAYGLFGSIKSDDQSLAIQVMQRCPHLVAHHYSLMSECVQKLSVLEFLPPQDQLTLETLVVNSLISLASEDLPLRTIVKSLVKCGFYYDSIRIILAKVAHIDKDKKGLAWFKEGCPEEDVEGDLMFKEVYNRYRILDDLFELPDAINIGLQFQDELFLNAYVHPKII